MRSTRGKFGLRMISTKKASQFFEESKDQLTATVFGIDQSPRNPDRSYWMNFLNQDTSVAFGLEKYAKAFNYPVFFCTIAKIKRGFYSVYFLQVTRQPQSEPPGRIIETTTRLLEEEIIKMPQYWLWTHKRWKHKRKL
jgi:Kdo2-lipid IVA lauroyltransferase/acyltransferase